MRHLTLAFLCTVILASGCRDLGVEHSMEARLEGQVYLISKPGPIPIGWIPPPLEQQCTIMILNTDRVKLREARTDNKGAFSISVNQGVYYLRVKESPLPAETGPYSCLAGRSTSAEAHVDNGLR